METLERVAAALKNVVENFGIPFDGQTIPLTVIALLGTGVFLTLRLKFVQVRHLVHGLGVTSGKYDDPDEPGDVSHFQALTTALSATVGIGNIAGAAIAIHWGGPGALFWMWVTALLGMATKFSEVTLAQHFRKIEKPGGRKWQGTVSGGPMYYIERGLGPAWKPLAVFFATMLGLTAFLTGNAVQANTVADTLQATFGLPVWISGLLTASLVGAVILGGISRIGRVTGILAPVMAAIYVAGALVIITLNLDKVLPAFGLIFQEAFSPSAGVAGTGVGAVIVTMMWGVNRGLFSNEAGQGSAPIAHAAAQTDEPVSEGAVALLEPFIDTIVIVTMTALVVIMTGAWNEKIPTEITLGSGDISYGLVHDGASYEKVGDPNSLRFGDGRPARSALGDTVLAWHEVAVQQLFTDEAQTLPFTGTVNPTEGTATGDDGTSYSSLYADAPESGAPLTMLGFREGLSPLGDWGHYVVLISVLLFGISTAISWSYYGDRCANYLFGRSAVLPYKIVFVLMHFLGAIVTLQVAWDLGDFFLGIVILPNLFALLLLSGKIKELMDSYFERKPWLENAEVHRQLMEQRRKHTDT